MFDHCKPTPTVACTTDYTIVYLSVLSQILQSGKRSIRQMLLLLYDFDIIWQFCFFWCQHGCLIFTTFTIIIIIAWQTCWCMTTARSAIMMIMVNIVKIIGNRADTKKATLDKDQLSNYRPISNLSLLSKIIEPVVKFRLTHHLFSNNLSTCLAIRVSPVP